MGCLCSTLSHTSHEEYVKLFREFSEMCLEQDPTFFTNLNDIMVAFYNYLSIHVPESIKRVEYVQFVNHVISLMKETHPNIVKTGMHDTRTGTLYYYFVGIKIMRFPYHRNDTNSLK